MRSLYSRGLKPDNSSAGLVPGRPPAPAELPDEVVKFNDCAVDDDEVDAIATTARWWRAHAQLYSVRSGQASEVRSGRS